MTSPLALASGTSGPHAWVGTQAPMLATNVMPGHATGHRLTPEHHGRYATVWLFERPLHGGMPWELVLDEAVRMLGETGTLVVRLVQSHGLTVFQFKRFLARNPFLDVSTVSESRDTTSVDLFTLALRVRRRHWTAYADRSWSVGVLTSGADTAGAVRFLGSVRRALGGREVDLMVAGPRTPELDELGVRYVAEDVGRVHPEIALKKNRLLEAAAHANVLLSHARFEIDKNFFDAFDEWGYDYEMAACVQRYEDGTPYPFYSAMPSTDLAWQHPLEVRDYNVLLPGQYVNGGLFVAKKHLREIGLCSLLFHNQAEDVEFSFALRERGVVPRVNHLATASTFGVTPDYTSAFSVYTPASAGGDGSDRFLAEQWTAPDDAFVEALYAVLRRRTPIAAELDMALTSLDAGASRFALAVRLAKGSDADSGRRWLTLLRVVRREPVRSRIVASVTRQATQRAAVKAAP